MPPARPAGTAQRADTRAGLLWPNRLHSEYAAFEWSDWHAVDRALQTLLSAARLGSPSAAEALGGIDVLVNNASGFGMTDDEAGWAAGLAVDVMAMVRATHAALPWLEKSGAGASIVHISSISALRPSTRSPACAAVKAAMNSYTGSQAAMLARLGIRVNAVAPGSIEFPGGTWEQRRLAGEALYDRVLESIPFGRLGTPDEVSEVALFRASNQARWMTGQVLVVDGGQLLGT